MNKKIVIVLLLLYQYTIFSTFYGHPSHEENIVEQCLICLMSTSNPITLHPPINTHPRLCSCTQQRSYCRTCIERWFKIAGDVCPICRKKIVHPHVLNELDSLATALRQFIRHQPLHCTLRVLSLLYSILISAYNMQHITYHLDEALYFQNLYHLRSSRHVNIQEQRSHTDTMLNNLIHYHELETFIHIFITAIGEYVAIKINQYAGITPEEDDIMLRIRTIFEHIKIGLFNRDKYFIIKTIQNEFEKLNDLP